MEQQAFNHFVSLFRDKKIDLSPLQSISPRNSIKYGCSVNVFGIPSTASPEEFKEFLEDAVGIGTISAFRLFTRVNSETLTGAGVVEFKTTEAAKRSYELSCNGGLCFRSSTLKIKRAKNKRRSQDKITVPGATLHVGCLLSRTFLHELWTTDGVVIEVDGASKKLRIYLKANMKNYMLEWRLWDIYEITSPRLEGRTGVKAMMIKVWTAPRVSEQFPSGIDHFFGNNRGFFSEDIELEWTRAIDFSDEASIGQSFIYCIETPEKDGKALDDLMGYLSEFKVEKRALSIRKGSSYSISQTLVPILGSLYINSLPFELIFLVNSLVQSGYLSGPGLGKHFFQMLQPSQEIPLKHISWLLSKLKKKQDTCYEPEKWLKSEICKFKKNGYNNALNKSLLEEGLVRIHRVFVTPCRVYCIGPEIDVSNRVTRHFIDHIDNFLRVSFVEEDYDKISSTALMHPIRRSLPGPTLQTKYTKVYERILSVLHDGIILGDKRFEFLAYSSSQLRENSVWMFSSDEEISPESIRNWMGDFWSIKNIAKCAARMGQSFSSSTKSFDVHTNEREKIPDILDSTSTYCFSDGIGKISESFATEVAQKCRLRSVHGRVPSLYQIRYGGYKGVVAVDPTGCHKLSLRQSMDKFPSTQIGLDILNWSHPIPSYLNRQIINLLSTLGVPDAVFEGMQTKMTQHLNLMLECTEIALDVLLMFCGGDNHKVMVEMLSAGYTPSSEPFLMRMLCNFRAVQLMYLRKKTRIFVPKGQILMGCLDETATLDYGEVFVSVSPRPVTPRKIFSDGLRTVSVCGVNGVTQDVCIVKGKIFVTKNPCVHPGDICVLTAVDVPALHHMVDCIVFPQRGARPHANECSGSDLDGDLYFVGWDEDLIPPVVDPPMDYQPPQQKTQYHPVTIQEIQEYFVDYMVNDSLGLISNAHTVFADSEPAKARDPKCIELAKLCSIAVDFPKTGVAAVLTADLRPTKYPDFMEKLDKPSYESERVLGKLYRLIQQENEVERASFFTKEEAARCYDKELLVNGFEHYLEEAQAWKNMYDDMLRGLMYQYNVKSEAEILTGNVLSLSKLYRKRPGEVKERIRAAVNLLKKEARSWLKDDEDNTDGDQSDLGTHTDEELAKASAWYHVTYHPNYVIEVNADASSEDGYLFSFPWVVYDKLLEIKKRHKHCR